MELNEVKDFAGLIDAADSILKAYYRVVNESAPIGADLKDLAARMKDLSDFYDKLKAAMDPANEYYDDLRLRQIPDCMANMDIRTVTYDGIGRVQLAADCYASIIADSKPLAFEWLRSNGFSDLIVETVNPSTLKSFAKEQMKAGTDLPEDLFKVTPFSRASIVKK